MSDQSPADLAPNSGSCTSSGIFEKSWLSSSLLFRRLLDDRSGRKLMAYQKPKNPANCKKRVKLAIKKLKMRSSKSCPYRHILKLTLMVATRLLTSTLSRPKKESRLSSHASPLVCTGYWWKRTKRKKLFLNVS